ncbi:hypothetical protein PT274_04145 [Leuconostocaceae bacterium ESL0958]|nr:hypothetical protein [Leuconostocaceae bacterium ESL0958]
MKKLRANRSLLVGAILLIFVAIISLTAPKDNQATAAVSLVLCLAAFFAMAYSIYLDPDWANKLLNAGITLSFASSAVQNLQTLMPNLMTDAAFHTLGSGFAILAIVLLLAYGFILLRRGRRGK